jgi:hypothetical protein
MLTVPSKAGVLGRPAKGIACNFAGQRVSSVEDMQEDMIGSASEVLQEQDGRFIDDGNQISKNKASLTVTPSPWSLPAPKSCILGPDAATLLPTIRNKRQVNKGNKHALIRTMHEINMH